MVWILGFFVFVFLFAALTYAFYWYDTANGPAFEELTLLSHGRPSRWVLRGLFWATAAQATALLTFPLGWFPQRKAASQSSTDSDSIVVTIHGLYHNRSAFFILEYALKRSGIRDVRHWSYPSWNQEFFSLAQKLRRDLESLHQSAPSRPLFLVGHSLGGLLARHAASSANEGTVSGCLTLGSPHQGSRLAVFALGTLGKSLGYRSPLIEALEREEKLRPAPRFPCVALASPIDNMVLPKEALIPKSEAWQVQWTPPISHVAMLYHPGVLRTVVSWIKDASSPKRQDTA